MTENEKLRMRKRDAFNGLLQRLNGTPDLTIKLALAALYLAIAIYLWAQQASVEIPALKHLMRYAIAAYLLLGGAALFGHAAFAGGAAGLGNAAAAAWHGEANQCDWSRCRHNLRRGRCAA